MLRDQPAPRTYERLDLQVFAVEVRYEEGPFALPASREVMLAELERPLATLEEAVRSDG